MRKYPLIIEEHNTTPLTISINWNGLQRLPEVLSGRHVGKDTFCEFWETSLRYYADGEKWGKVSRYIFERVKRDQQFVKRLLHESVKRGSRLQTLVQDFHRFDPAQKSTRALERFIKSIFEEGGKFCAFGFIPVVCDMRTSYLTNEGNAIIQSRAAICKKYKRSIAEVFTLLTTPSLLYPSDVAKEELRTILQKRGSRGAWLGKWYWIIFGHLGPGITKKTLARFIRQEMKGKNIHVEKQRLAKEQKLWEKRLRFTPRERRILNAMRTFVYLKGYRGEVLYGLYASLHRLLPVVSERSGIDAALLFYTHPSEFCDLLTRKVVRAATLRARRQYCTWIAHSPWCATILTGTRAHQYSALHSAAEEEVRKTDIVEGQVAYAGKATGTVLIINSVADMKKVRGPFILVAAQTTPELLPAMKKAKAFVSDIGGVTCHTAIVAREMKKPCVIGTKIATKVFHDGDRVEVDATHGVIRKL